MRTERYIGLLTTILPSQQTWRVTSKPAGSPGLRRVCDVDCLCFVNYGMPSINAR
jgi:hypothetical protein